MKNYFRKVERQCYSLTWKQCQAFTKGELFQGQHIQKDISNMFWIVLRYSNPNLHLPIRNHQMITLRFVFGYVWRFWTLTRIWTRGWCCKLLCKFWSHSITDRKCIMKTFFSRFVETFLSTLQSILRHLYFHF